MQPQPSSNLLMAIAATAELCDKVLTPAAARMFAADLAGYDEDAVLAALTRCRKELAPGKFCVRAVVERIEDGRPGVEQAWAMLPMNESASVVWTDEMVAAWAAASPLLADGDRIGARMAFKEVYTVAVAQARDACRPVRWSASIGTDKAEATRVLTEAARLGRLPGNYVAGLLSHHEAPPAPAIAALLTSKVVPRLIHHTEEQK